MSDLTNKQQEYGEKYEKHAGSPKSLKWFSYKAAAARYKQIVSDINFEGKSILDVGCGFGDIIPYISAQTNEFTYTGIDMMEQFVTQAQTRYPDFTFIKGDYFRRPMEERFDIIICCGALNSQLPNVMDYRQKAIATMYEHANEAVVFNMAGGSPQPVNKDSLGVYYADSREVLDKCLELTSRVTFKQQYAKKDFTIALYK